MELVPASSGKGWCTGRLRSDTDRPYLADLIDQLRANTPGVAYVIQAHNYNADGWKQFAAGPARLRVGGKSCVLVGELGAPWWAE